MPPVFQVGRQSPAGEQFEWRFYRDDTDTSPSAQSTAFVTIQAAEADAYQFKGLVGVAEVQVELPGD
jgi:hypothetical protein